MREELRASYPRSTFDLWLEPLEAVSATGSTLVLSAPPAIRAWVERRYGPALVRAIGSRAPALTEVAFVDAAARHGTKPERERRPESLPLDPSHTFEEFVIGPGNRLAHAAALAVAESPGEAYNPLFLHGPPGLGKTHLLGAIVEYLRRNHPELEVHYTTAERFTTEFVGALQREGPEAFKARYRGLDALLIDDVQVLEGKQRTEEEFVHTFNTLHSAGKQIVLSSDRPPEALSKLAERLRDRFNWGLRVELEPPDLRTRIAVLWRIASGSGSELPDPRVLQEIATNVPENVRVLEGAMTRVMAIASLLSEPLTTPIVRRALGRRRAGGGGRGADAGGDPGCRLRRQRPDQGGAALAAPLAEDRPLPTAGDVHGAGAHRPFAGRDRPGLRSRPHHRHARDPLGQGPARARIRDRRDAPPRPRPPGDEAARPGPVHRDGA